MVRDGMCIVHYDRMINKMTPNEMQRSCQRNLPLSSFRSLRDTHLTRPGPKLHSSLGSLSSLDQTKLLSSHPEDHLVANSLTV